MSMDVSRAYFDDPFCLFCCLCSVVPFDMVVFELLDCFSCLFVETTSLLIIKVSTIISIVTPSMFVFFVMILVSRYTS